MSALKSTDSAPTEAKASGHPILAALEPDEQALVDVVSEPWLGTGKWPVFDYVNRVLSTRTGADATVVMSRLPVLQGGHATSAYRLVFTERRYPYGQPNERIGLTIAGLSHVTPMPVAVGQLLTVMTYLAQADAERAPDPDRPVGLDVPIIDLLSNNLRRELRGWGPEALGRALEHEPPLWGAVQSGDEVRIRPQAGRLSGFRSIGGIDDYVDRMVVFLGAYPRRQSSAAQPSPLSLAEGLGYLDAVWQLRFGAHLLGRAQPASWARLGLSCSTIEEFDSRLSALADVLGQMTVALSSAEERLATGAHEGSLARLRRKLRAELDADAYERVDAAINILRNIIRIRVGAQHSGRAPEAAKAFASLGLPFPPSDPAAGWESIRSLAATAVSGIREELQAAGRPI